MNGFVLCFGISTPICWKPSFENSVRFSQITWLFFEVILIRSDFITFLAGMYVDGVSEEIRRYGDGESITYRVNNPDQTACEVRDE